MPEKVKSEGTKREDLSFGQIAIREQFVSPDRVLECLEIQRKLQDLDLESKRIGDILIEKGYLTREQARRIADLQAEKKTPSRPRTSRISKKPPAIPGYEILGVLGRGANGTVYRARQISMDRMVAIKILAKKQGTDKAFVDRFIREAQVVARLNHENIILGIDVGESQGLHYFVMELVDGEPVSAILKRDGRIDEKRSIQIGLPILKALSHAREHGLVHRDVKPENIMIAGNGVAKLCDLGLAKQTREEGADLTREGISVGTPNYISPEQARGESEIDTRSDIYSLGASLYHMVTGSPVFTGPNPMVIMTKHVTERPEPPMKKFSGLSAGLNAVIMKMIQKRREDRYQTPADVEKDLESVLSGRAPSVLGSSPSSKITRRVQGKSDLSPAIRTRRRPVKKSVPPAVPILIALGVAVGIGFLVFSFMGNGPPAVPEPGKAKETVTNPVAKETPAASAGQKFKEDAKTFRSYWNGKIEKTESGWVQAIYNRGETYLQQYEMKATEHRMIDLVRESRDEVDKIILDRLWNDLRAKAEEARKTGAFAEAVRTAESIGKEYLYFQTSPKEVRTKAGEQQQKYLRNLLEEELPLAYISDHNKVRDAGGIQAYHLIGKMFGKYGEKKRKELVQLRKGRLSRDMQELLSSPLTEKKLEEASALLAALLKKWPSAFEFQADLRREEEAMKKRKEAWIKDSEALAGDLFKNSFLVPFESALSLRDLMAVRALLHEVYFGKSYAAASPAIFSGEMERTLLGAILNPKRVAVLNYPSFVTAVEKAVRTAMGNRKTAAVDFYLSLRSYLLVESFIESASRGVDLQSKDTRKFSKFSPELRGVRQASILARKAGSAWKISATRKSGGGTVQKEIFLAPKGSPTLPGSDVLLLAKRANVKTWKIDPYFALQAGLFFLYAGKFAEAREWLGKVTGVDAGLEIKRFLDRLTGSPSGNKEETAREKFKQASKLLARETKRALALCHELRDQFSTTEWMTTRLDENGRKMEKNRIEVVLFWIELLEKNSGKTGNKEEEQGLFRGDVDIQDNNKAVAFYDFKKEGLGADFAPVWEINARQERDGIRLSGRGAWYWKAPLLGDVSIEMEVIAHSNQAIGAMIHGEGFEKGYQGIADMEGGGAWRPLEGQSLIFQYPVREGSWQDSFIAGGSRNVAFQRGKPYNIRFERKGEKLSLYVGGKLIESGKSREYNDGKIGIVLSQSEILLKRLRITGEIDEDWLRGEKERIEEK